MARGLRPSAGHTRWAVMALALLAAAVQAQESGATAPEASMAGESVPLRLTHAPTRPVLVHRRLDGVVAGTLAMTAPQRIVPLDRTAPEAAPPVKPASWHAGLGLTLSGGDRIGVRRADGGTQLVWRRQF